MDASDLSIAGVELPFKVRPYATESNSRRNKTLKQIINNERDEKLQKAGIDARGKKRTATPKRQRLDDGSIPAEGTAEAGENPATEETVPERQVPTCACLLLTDTSVEAPPSLLPRKKYCDVTGLKGNYTDPKSRLHYHSAEVYGIIKGFVRLPTNQGPGADNAYLALRGDAAQLL